MFKNLIRENVVVFSKENTVYYTSLFQNDLAVVEKTLIEYFALCMQIAELVFSLAYAFLQNVTVGLMLIVVGIAGMVIPILAQKILRKNQETLMNEAAKHNGFSCIYADAVDCNCRHHGFERKSEYFVYDGYCGIE